MDSKLSEAQALTQKAIQAAQHGDRLSARRYSEQAAALAPQLEQSWLMLVYLSSPKVAQYYLERARQANPASQQVQAAQDWLHQQSAPVGPLAAAGLMAEPPATDLPTAPHPVAQLPAQPVDLPTAPLAVIEQPAEPPTQPVAVLETRSLPGEALSTPPAGNSPAPTAAGARRWSPAVRYIGLVALLLVMLLGVAAFSSSRPPAQTAPTPVRVTRTVQKTVAAPSATLPATRTAFVPAVALDTAIPSLPPSATPAAATPTAAATASPTANPTSAASATPTAKPSATQPASPTAKPTQASSRQYTVASGDTLAIIAQRFNISVQNLVAANNLPNPSMIMAGQVLTIPAPGSVPASQATATSAPPGPTGAKKEIQIDISEQHLYAYQDGELVISLVVSTGIGNSTRIGTFKVLDKIPNAYSNAFGIWMPYWLGIYYSGTLENGIHGLPLLWNGVELWGNLLGKPATYGCIESRTPDIKKLYDWAEIGTPVIIRR